MILLICGLSLWIAAHVLKRVAPDLRASMGDPGKGGVAVLLVLSVVLMVLGYRAAEFTPLYTPAPWLTHVNNLLMVFAFYMFAIAGQGGWLDRKVRHSMLAGMKIWAFAHLLVNGDLASFVLFGGLLLWAVAEMVIINRAEPTWEAPAPAVRRKEFTFPAASVVAVGLVGYIHGLIGPSPFGG